MTEGDRQGGIFVVGCPRSGTTVLASRVLAACGVAVPFESHVIPVFWRWRFLYGKLEIRRNRDRLLNDFYRFMRLYLAASQTLDVTRLLPASLIATESARDGIVRDSHSFGQLVNAMFQAFATGEGLAIWADYSTYTDPISPDLLAEAVGDIKVIHLVRDGRDVYASWRKPWYRPANAVEGALKWRRHVSLNRAWGMRNPDRYLEIRYEDMIAAPETVRDRLAEFIGVTSGPVKVSESALAKNMADADEHKLLGRRIDPTNSGKWRVELSRLDQAVFQQLAGRCLLASGYDPRPADGPQPGPAVVWAAIALGWVRTPFRAVWWKLRIKNALPAIFRVIPKNAWF